MAITLTARSRHPETDVGPGPKLPQEWLVPENSSFWLHETKTTSKTRSRRLSLLVKGGRIERERMRRRRRRGGGTRGLKVGKDGLEKR